MLVLDTAARICRKNFFTRKKSSVPAVRTPDKRRLPPEVPDIALRAPVFTWNSFPRPMENTLLSTCKALDSTSRQVDAAFACGEVLVIGECKSKRRHLGLENGGIEATEGHRQFLQNLLSEVDLRAVWLAHHPVGTNYDISDYRWIFPVGITPFVEFIWSLNPNLWIESSLPRILTPTELRDFLNGESAAAVLTNHSAAIRVRGS